MARSLVSPSAASVRQLKAVALGLKLLEKDARKQINASIRGELNHEWKAQVAENAAVSGMDSAIFAKGARIAGGNPARAMAGTSRRPLSPGGASPVDLARAWEFGAPTRQRHEETYQRRSENGGTHSVTRHTKRQVPRAASSGRVVYPAWAEWGPRAVSMWVQIIVRNFHEKLEEK